MASYLFSEHDLNTYLKGKGRDFKIAIQDLNKGYFESNTLDDLIDHFYKKFHIDPIIISKGGS